MTTVSRPVERPVRARRSLGLTTAVCAAAMGVPMFFTLAGAVYRGTPDPDGTYLPLSLFTSSLFLLVRFKDLFSIKWNVLHALAVIIPVYAIVLFIAGQFSIGYTGDPSLIGVFIAPLILGIFCGSVMEGDWSGEKALDVVSGAMAIIAIGHAITSLVQTGVAGTFSSFARGSDDFAGLFNIHQRLIYIPLVMSYCVVWTIFISRMKVIYKIIISSALFLDIVIDAAREPFVTMIVMMLLLSGYWAYENTKKSWFKVKIVMGFIVTLGIIGAALASLLAETYVVKKFLNIGGGSIDDLTGGRSDRISMFTDAIYDHPFFGEFMQFSTNSRLTPHNQFMEGLLRGGIFFLIFVAAPVIWIIAVTLQRFIKVRRLEPVPQMGLILAITFLFVNWNVNTPLRSPFCMIYVTTIFGMVAVHRTAWAKLDRASKKGAARGAGRRSLMGQGVIPAA